MHFCVLLLLVITINHSMGVAEALQDIFSRQINQTG